MKLRFIKIAAYDPKIINSDKFVAYRKIGLQLADPEISKPISYVQIFNKNNFDLIYSSNLKRGQESSKYLSKNIKFLSGLNEIKFDLKKLVTKNEYNRYGSKIVRHRFVEAFIQDKLLESRQEIFKRIEKVLFEAKVRNHSSAVLVSHSFIMKVFESYINNHQVIKNPSLLNNYILPDVKTYEFGGGFTINLN